MLPGLLLMACTSREPVAERPDVLVVVVDTLRADALSAYGNPRATTPQMNALAESGVLFEDVTASGSWTWPSHAALFTGKPQWVNGARTRSAPLESASGDDSRLAQVTPMRTDLPTLAGLLSEAGYQATALSENSWLHPSLGLTRGFGRAEVIQGCNPINDQLTQTLTQGGDTPQLAFINLLMAHAPWQLTPAPWSQAHTETLAHPPEWAAPFVIAQPPTLDLYRPAGEGLPSGFQSYMAGSHAIPESGLAMIRDLYEGEVAAVDYCLNRLLNTWLAHSPDGIVVLTSDHGEYLGERGLLEHGQTIWREVTAVPLIIAAPGRLTAGQRVATPVQLHDVPGTILELVGLEADMPSLLPIIGGAPRSGPILAAAWHHPEPAEGIGGPFLHDWFLYREGSEVLVWSPTGTDQLFDLSTDKAAQNDLAAARPERVAALRAAAAEAYPVHDTTGTLTLAPDIEEALREMGYLE